MVAPPSNEIKSMLNEVIDYATASNDLKFNTRLADAAIDMESFVEANMVQLRLFLSMRRIDPSDSEKERPCRV